MKQNAWASGIPLLCCSFIHPNHGKCLRVQLNYCQYYDVMKHKSTKKGPKHVSWNVELDSHQFLLQVLIIWNMKLYSKDIQGSLISDFTLLKLLHYSCRSISQRSYFKPLCIILTPCAAFFISYCSDIKHRLNNYLIDSSTVMSLWNFIAS